MDENLSRALTIGASVIMIIGTITAVLVYYNLAQEGAGVAERKNLSLSREELFYDDLRAMKDKNNSQITGIEARNIIFEFSGNLDNIKVDWSVGGAISITNINQIKDPLTGQQDYLRINNIILPTDKVEIQELKLDENNEVYVRLNKITK